VGEWVINLPGFNVLSGKKGSVVVAAGEERRGWCI
jgi:hypothetical protein